MEQVLKNNHISTRGISKPHQFSNHINQISPLLLQITDANQFYFQTRNILFFRINANNFYVHAKLDDIHAKFSIGLLGHRHSNYSSFKCKRLSLINFGFPEK